MQVLNAGNCAYSILFSQECRLLAHQSEHLRQQCGKRLSAILEASDDENIYCAIPQWQRELAAQLSPALTVPAPQAASASASATSAAPATTSKDPYLGY